MFVCMSHFLSSNVHPQCASSLCVLNCGLNMRPQFASSMWVLNMRPQCASSMCVLTKRSQFASSMCVLNCCPQCESSMSSSLYVLSPHRASSIKRMHVFISFSSIYTYTIHTYMYIYNTYIYVHIQYIHICTFILKSVCYCSMFTFKGWICWSQNCGLKRTRLKLEIFDIPIPQ